MWKKCGIPRAVHFKEYELQRFHQIKVFSESIVLVIRISIADCRKPSGTGESIAIASETDPIQGGIADRLITVVTTISRYQKWDFIS
jgi:hypothetical protein